MNARDRGNAFVALARGTAASDLVDSNGNLIGEAAADPRDILDTSRPLIDLEDSPAPKAIFGSTRLELMVADYAKEDAGTGADGTSEDAQS
jgi:hypothetical protein